MARTWAGAPEIFVHGHRLVRVLSGHHPEARGVEPLVTPVLVAHGACTGMLSEVVACCLMACCWLPRCSHPPRAALLRDKRG